MMSLQQQISFTVFGKRRGRGRILLGKERYNTEIFFIANRLSLSLSLQEIVQIENPFMKKIIFIDIRKVVKKYK